MPNRSGCLIALLVFIALANLAGLYLYIDAQSRFTQALAHNTEQLDRFESLLERLYVQPVSPQAPSSTVPSPSSVQATPAMQAPLTTGEPAAFANSEFRQVQAAYGGKRVTSTSTFSGNFNSIVQNESVTSEVWSLCNDDLARRNFMDPQKFQPLMAERWSVTPDGLIYEITLRKGMMWHPFTDPVTKADVPAKEVTSDDFVFYWDTLRNPDVQCEPQRVYLQLMKGIEATGRYTIRVTWKEPYSKSEEVTLGLSPLPRHYYRPDAATSDKEFAQQMNSGLRNQFIVGCGPFRFAEYKTNEFIRLERYEDYYGPKPYLKSLVMKVIPEPSIAFLELKKGGIDDLQLQPEQWVKEALPPLFHTVTPNIGTAIADSAAWDDLKQAGKLPSDAKLENYQYERSAAPWYYIGYNQRNPLFQDKATRQAFACMTNRPRIIKEVFYDLAKPVDGPFTWNCPYADPSIKPFDFNPARAKELLKSAGWADTDGDGILDKQINGKKTDLTFNLMIAQVSVNGRKISTILQADMAKVGIKLQVQPLEWAVMGQRLNKHEFDACLLGWTGTLEPDPFQIWHSSQADITDTSNHIGYKNKHVDELIDQGRRTVDKAKRTVIYREFFRVIQEDQPYTFLVSPTALLTQSARFRNARVYGLGMDGEHLQWLPLRLQGE